MAVTFNPLHTLSAFHSSGAAAKVSSAVAKVWICLLSHANGEGECHPSRAKIGAETGLSKRMVVYAIQQLKPLVDVTVGNGRGHVSSYQLHIPTEERVQWLHPLERRPLVGDVKGATVAGLSERVQTATGKGANGDTALPRHSPPIPPEPTTHSKPPIEEKSTPPKPVKVIQYEDQDVKCTGKFEEAFRQKCTRLHKYPAASKKGFGTGEDRETQYDAARRLREDLGKDYRDRINAIFLWLKGDTKQATFWFPGNIRGMLALRKQFERLEDQMQEEGKDEQGQAQQQDTWVTNIIR